MFKDIFSRKSHISDSVLSDEKALIMDLHSNVDEAADILIKQAKEALAALSLNPVSKDLQCKASRLKALGFIKTPSVEDADKEAVILNSKKEKETEIRRNLELALYYKKTYPFHKFITEETLISLCNKYGLIIGPVSSI
jgi:hypothetical protein